MLDVLNVLNDFTYNKHYVLCFMDFPNQHSIIVKGLIFSQVKFSLLHKQRSFKIKGINLLEGHSSKKQKKRENNNLGIKYVFNK